MAPPSARLAAPLLLLLVAALAALGPPPVRAGEKGAPVIRRCEAGLLATAAAELRLCLQNNADLIFPAFNQSDTIISNLAVLTSLVNSEMRRRRLETTVAPLTASTLGNMRLLVESVRPFKLTVAYPTMTGDPTRQRGNTDAGNTKSLTRSNHDTSVCLSGDVVARSGALAFGRLDIDEVKFNIQDFTIAEGGGEETLSMSKTTVSEHIGMRLSGKPLLFAGVMLELFADPGPSGG